LLKPKRNQSSLLGKREGVFVVAAGAAICGLLVYAEFASENWLIKVRCLELRNPVGKTMTDPISDMLTRIRNAQAVGHAVVILPFSKIKFSLAEILKKEGFVKSVSKKGRGIKRKIEIELLYEDEKNAIPKIKQLKRISKPGKREYVRAKDVHPVLGGRGISIISTSQGLMIGKEAKKKGLGGEALCEIW